MLNWYKNLYIGDNAKKKSKKLIHKINQGAGVIDVYVITLAVNPENSLEIFSANLLMQSALRRNCPIIIGLAKGYEEALEIIEQIVNEVYQETADARHRERGGQCRAAAGERTVHRPEPPRPARRRHGIRRVV